LTPQFLREDRRSPSRRAEQERTAHLTVKRWDRAGYSSVTGKKKGLTAGPLLQIKVFATLFSKLHQTTDEVRT
jgi:hypothetical protein